MSSGTSFLSSKILAGILLLVVVLFGVFFLLNNSSDSKRPPREKIAFGAWTEGLFDGSTRTLHPEKLLAFEQLIKRKAAIAHYYLGWEYLDRPEILEHFTVLRSNGWQPMVNVNPYFFDECPVSDLPLYRAIAQGKCDDFLHRSGKNLAQVQEPFYLGFAWEVNNHNHEWSISRTTSTPQDYVAAWQHIHDIFEEEKADKVIWVFNPNIPDDPTAPYGEIYPGDEFVDWIGLDGYNWGTTQSWSQWTRFADVFRGSYELLTSIAPNKPLMLAEVNTTDKGGDKAAWYKDMFLKQIPDNFPQIEAVIIFNEDRTKTENVNWKVDVTKQSLDAFIDSVNSPYYK